jgi:uncharacterized protein YgiM (DUF1202 family)
MSINTSKILATGIVLSLALWISNAQATSYARIKITKDNTLLMSKPIRHSRVLLKLPKGYDVVSRMSESDYKRDRFGNEWYYVKVFREKEYKGWIMKSSFVVIGGG